jgi:hypothetical protein
VKSYVYLIRIAAGRPFTSAGSNANCLTASTAAASKLGPPDASTFASVTRPSVSIVSASTTRDERVSPAGNTAS